MIPVYQFHIPFNLKRYSFLSIGEDHQYTEDTDEVLVTSSLTQLEKTLKDHKRLALVLSGTFIEYLQLKKPKLLSVIKERLKKEELMLLGTSYHSSLASLYSPGLFKEQIRMHQLLVKKMFDYTPEIFYNTATLYFDKLSAIYKELNFTTAIVPISDWHLNGRDRNQVFKGNEELNLILMEDSDASLNENKIGLLDLSVLKLLPEKKSTEKYHVPQPIYNKRLVSGKTLSSNALQNAIHQKIIYLKKRIKKQNRTELYSALSLFTSLDFFDMLTKTDDQNNRVPYEQYTNLMNALTDFELVNKI